MTDQHNFLRLGAPAMAPQAFAAFVIDHPEQAKVVPNGPVDLHEKARAEMLWVSGRVNQGIEWVEPDGDLMQPWHILLGADGLPAGRGDCCSFAATKRAMLLDRGWPPGALLFAEVVAPEFPDDRHMVLVVRTIDGDLVLDNLAPGQAPVWWVRRFRWVRMQSPAGGGAWCEVANGGGDGDQADGGRR